VSCSGKSLKFFTIGSCIHLVLWNFSYSEASGVVTHIQDFGDGNSSEAFGTSAWVQL
ncbi:hypothetical protein GCK32_021283, partial [Trichostrongylus colubriformis]